MFPLFFLFGEWGLAMTKKTSLPTNVPRWAPLLVLLLIGSQCLQVHGRKAEVAASQPIDVFSGGQTHAVATLQFGDQRIENAFTERDSTDSFVSVSLIACFNIVFNILRPDAFISWQMRLPRVMWELTLFSIANMTRKPNPPPAIYILLALTTASTAAIDIFLWAPAFAALSKFETTCVGGWFTGRPYVCRTDYIMGFGRLLVSVQSLCTGVVYLSASVNAALAAITSLRDEQKVKRHVRAMELA